MIGRVRAIVLVVGDAVTVLVVVAGIANAVTIQIELIGILGLRAIVDAVIHAITVLIGVLITGITDIGVAVVGLLIGIADRRAIVVLVGNPVVVEIPVTGITDLAVRVVLGGLVVVGIRRAVVLVVRNAVVVLVLHLGPVIVAAAVVAEIDILVVVAARYDYRERKEARQ